MATSAARSRRCCVVNEQLEAELAQFYAAVGLDGMARGSNAVH